MWRRTLPIRRAYAGSVARNPKRACPGVLRHLGWKRLSNTHQESSRHYATLNDKVQQLAARRLKEYAEAHAAKDRLRREGKSSTVRRRKHPESHLDTYGRVSANRSGKASEPLGERDSEKHVPFESAQEPPSKEDDRTQPRSSFIPEEAPWVDSQRNADDTIDHPWDPEFEDTHKTDSRPGQNEHSMYENASSTQDKDAIVAEAPTTPGNRFASPESTPEIKAKTPAVETNTPRPSEPETTSSRNYLPDDDEGAYVDAHTPTIRDFAPSANKPPKSTQATSIGTFDGASTEMSPEKPSPGIENDGPQKQQLANSTKGESPPVWTSRGCEGSTTEARLSGVPANTYLDTSEPLPTWETVDTREAVSKMIDMLPGGLEDRPSLYLYSLSTQGSEPSPYAFLVYALHHHRTFAVNLEKLAHEAFTTTGPAGSQTSERTLKDILESPSITKVLFDARWTCHQFAKLFSVRLHPQGVVDLQLMDAATRPKRLRSRLAEAIADHLIVAFEDPTIVERWYEVLKDAKIDGTQGFQTMECQDVQTLVGHQLQTMPAMYQMYNATPGHWKTRLAKETRERVNRAMDVVSGDVGRLFNDRNNAKGWYADANPKKGTPATPRNGGKNETPDHLGFNTDIQKAQRSLSRAFRDIKDPQIMASMLEELELVAQNANLSKRERRERQLSGL